MVNTKKHVREREEKEEEEKRERREQQEEKIEKRAVREALDKNGWVIGPRCR